jgi:hypothetical protein
MQNAQADEQIHRWIGPSHATSFNLPCLTHPKHYKNLRLLIVSPYVSYVLRNDPSIIDAIPTGTISLDPKGRYGDPHPITGHDPLKLKSNNNNNNKSTSELDHPMLPHSPALTFLYRGIAKQLHRSYDYDKGKSQDLENDEFGQF